MEKKLSLIALCLVLLFPRVSFANETEEQILPKGTLITIPNRESFQLEDRMFLVKRDSIDKANACHRSLRRVEDELTHCNVELLKKIEAKEEKSSLWKWTGLSIALIGSFALGYKLGR